MSLTIHGDKQRRYEGHRVAEVTLRHMLSPASKLAMDWVRLG